MNPQSAISNLQCICAGVAELADARDLKSRGLTAVWVRSPPPASTCATMKTRDRPRDSLWRLLVDLLSAKALVWVAGVGKEAELTPEAHIYFFDRYRRLAEYHRAHGRLARAARLQAKANEHYRPGSGDGPPYAAAMAMPRPRRFVQVNAVSSRRLDGPDDAA